MSANNIRESFTILAEDYTQVLTCSVSILNKLKPKAKHKIVMKTRFDFSREVFSIDGNLLDCYDYYEQNLKEFGFILDKEEEAVYKELDKEIILNEGDRVILDGIGLSIITWRCYDIDKDLMTYVLIEE